MDAAVASITLAQHISFLSFIPILYHNRLPDYPLPPLKTVEINPRKRDFFLLCYCFATASNQANHIYSSLIRLPRSLSASRGHWAPPVE